MFAGKFNRAVSGQDDVLGFFHQRPGHRNRIKDVPDGGHSGETAGHTIDYGGIHFHNTVKIKHGAIPAVKFGRFLQYTQHCFQRLDAAFCQEIMPLQGRILENFYKLFIPAGVQPAMYSYNSHGHSLGIKQFFYAWDGYGTLEKRGQKS